MQQHRPLLSRSALWRNHLMRWYNLREGLTATDDTLPDRFFDEPIASGPRQGDRLDNITAEYLGDPEQFWRICDANATLHPAELEEVGRRLRITLSEGIPGMPNA